MLHRALILTLALAVSPARAYDSTGGAALEALLAKLVFQESPNRRLLSPVFEWDEARKDFARDRVRRSLSEMPLDAAQLSGITKVVVSNASHACTTDSVFEIRVSGRFRGAAETLIAYNCRPFPAFSPDDGELLIAGAALTETIRYGDAPETDALPGFLLHESVHVWSQGRAAALAPFHKLRHAKIFKPWKRIQDAHRHWLAERRVRREAADETETEAGKEADEADIAQIVALERVQYRNMRLPSRRMVLGGEEILDLHPMDPNEYLACLVEMLWTDPDWARTQFSPEEIAWARRHVLEGRIEPRARVAAAAARIGERALGLAESLGLQ